MSKNTINFDNSVILPLLGRKQLEKMQQAGKVITDSMRFMKKANANVVGQCLANQGTFYEFDHYPSGDVFDSEFNAQYYYHSHRPEAGEHGHFHTFLRAKGMPEGVNPIDYKGEAKRPEGDEALSHLIAIAMDQPGQPIALFTTNRWVSDETWYPAEDVIKMLDRFRIEHTFPCLAVNQWLSAMLILFRPQIDALLLSRDETMKDWAASHEGVDIYEDRDLDVTSFLPINTQKQIDAVNKALEVA